MVESSIGHIRDLPKKGGMAIDIDNGFKPTYEIAKDKEKVVKHLKNIAKEAKTIWLATDEDREGEAIAWHLIEALKLDQQKPNELFFMKSQKKQLLML